MYLKLDNYGLADFPLRKKQRHLDEVVEIDLNSRAYNFPLDVGLDHHRIASLQNGLEEKHQKSCYFDN